MTMVARRYTYRCGAINSVYDLLSAVIVGVGETLQVFAGHEECRDGENNIYDDQKRADEPVGHKEEDVSLIGVDMDR